MTGKVNRLAHVCIYAADLEATRSFYADLLGMETAFTFEKDGELFGFYLGCGQQTFIEVFQGEPGSEGNIRHLALDVEGMDELIQRLHSAGITVSEKTLGADHTWQAWTEDPNGIRIELHEYTPDSMQLRGGTCQVNW